MHMAGGASTSPSAFRHDAWHAMLDRGLHHGRTDLGFRDALRSVVIHIGDLRHSRLSLGSASKALTAPSLGAAQGRRVPNWHRRHASASKRWRSLGPAGAEEFVDAPACRLDRLRDIAAQGLTARWFGAGPASARELLIEARESFLLQIPAEPREGEGANRQGGSLQLVRRLSPDPARPAVKRGCKRNEAFRVEAQQLLAQLRIAADLSVKMGGIKHRSPSRLGSITSALLRGAAISTDFPDSSSVLLPNRCFGEPQPGLMSPSNGGFPGPPAAMVARPLTTFCKAERARVSNFARPLYTDVVNGAVHGRVFARKKGRRGKYMRPIAGFPPNRMLRGVAYEHETEAR